MSAIFVHVSDIHFGQERHQRVYIHEDVKRELIADATEVVASLSPSGVKGVLVTGDVAYSGKAEQYDVAGHWLDALADGIGCPIHQVQLVPGNHDVDREKLSVGGEHLLAYIRQGGPAEYEKVMSNDFDRATLFQRFEEYGRFSIGYKCGLDAEAKLATNLRVEVGPGRWIRFVRLNSSLLCHGAEQDDQPELVIGERQFVIPRHAGEENVVLVHHPLNWYKDAEDVRDYVRSRARVFISGHEHDPKVAIDEVAEDCDVMMLAAGAAVPFKSDDTYTHTYNVIEFDWDEAADSLVVTIHPRAWNASKTCFEADEKRLGGKNPRFTLGSPNFKKADPSIGQGEQSAAGSGSPHEQMMEVVPVEDAEGEEAAITMAVEGYDLALLRFFRDLYEGERLRILVDLDALQPGLDEEMNQGLELRLFNWLVGQNRLPEIVSMTDRLLSERKEGNA